MAVSPKTLLGNGCLEANGRKFGVSANCFLKTTTQLSDQKKSPTLRRGLVRIRTHNNQPTAVGLGALRSEGDEKRPMPRLSPSGIRVCSKLTNFSNSLGASLPTAHGKTGPCPLGSKADMKACKRHVHFTPESRHSLVAVECLLGAKPAYHDPLWFFIWAAPLFCMILT